MKYIITFLLFAVFSTVVTAQTVSISGTSYPTISAAITAAVDGDIVNITGLHTESLVIDKNITIRGTNPANDIVQAAETALSNGAGSRVINVGAPAAANLTVTIENLTIRNGNSPANGGGINVDKVTGLVTLRNLIITNNYTATNGGGLGIAGSNMLVTGCSILNNNATLDGGAIIAAPNNGSAANSTLDIKQSLINGNIGRNGGGMYINGNNGFGNDYTISVNVENSTISNNSTFSPAGGNGGGAVFCTSFPLTTNTSIGNSNLRFIHTTVYNNSHANLIRAGLQFAGNAATPTNFSAYNSIIVAVDDLNTKAINFANTNTTNVVNCILGGLNLAPALIDDVAKNNQKGKTATQSGLTGTLTNEGGSTQVIAITPASAAVNFCTGVTGVTIPTVDQRGYARAGVQDAGAYELDGVLSTNPFDLQNASISLYPNPTADVLNFKSEKTISAVSIYDMTGRKVFHSDFINANRINVAQLSSGLHLVELEIEGQKIVKRVLIK
jgi:hypothetical protein